jgi:hypothetical protein
MRTIVLNEEEYKEVVEAMRKHTNDLVEIVCRTATPRDAGRLSFVRSLQRRVHGARQWWRGR